MARKPTAQSRRVAVALRKLEPLIREAFKMAIAKASSAIDEKALLQALEAGDINRAMELLRIDHALLAPLYEAVRSGYMSGGNLVTLDLSRGMSARWGFDGRHSRAESWVAQHGAELIEGIATDGIDVARKVITEGLKEGVNHRSIARQLTGHKVGNRRVGGFLGLNSDQADSIIRARQILSDPDQIRKYFIKDAKTGRMKPRFRLSDRTFDGKVRAAIKDGRALSGADLDRVIAAHKSKALGYRGRVIAKHEAHSALSAGREEGYYQILDDPEVEAISVRWQHNLSNEPRKEHVAMSGTVIQLGETFDFSDASMKRPHDPAGGAKHSLGCRCIGVYRIRLRKD